MIITIKKILFTAAIVAIMYGCMYPNNTIYTTINGWYHNRRENLPARETSIPPNLLRREAFHRARAQRVANIRRNNNEQQLSPIIAWENEKAQRVANISRKKVRAKRARTPPLQPPVPKTPPLAYMNPPKFGILRHKKKRKSRREKKRKSRREKQPQTLHSIEEHTSMTFK